MRKGLLEIVMGPMFAGKTTALLTRAERANGSILVFKPAFDTRYAISEIKTHDGKSLGAINVTCVADVLDALENNPAVKDGGTVFFDEVQFFEDPQFSGDFFALVDKCLAQGIHVVGCGLDLTWQAEPFAVTAKLAKKADIITLLKARCSVCGRPAAKSFKRSGTSAKIELGSADIYQPRCDWHFYEFENTAHHVYNDHGAPRPLQIRATHEEKTTTLQASA